MSAYVLFCSSLFFLYIYASFPISSLILQTASGFVSFVTNWSQLRLLQPKTQGELEHHCTKKKACAIISSRKKLSEYHTRVLRDAMQKYRNITFAYLTLKRGALTAEPALPALEVVIMQWSSCRE
jgi:hypothetical protein